MAILIIGAGPAGLALSYHLTRRGRAHTLLEAGRAGESWRRRRWDSLRLVAPNWHLQLPGFPYAGPDPDGFLHRDEVAAYIEAYARAIEAPVIDGVTVTALRQSHAGPGLVAESDAGAFAADQVVVATGAYTTPRVPACAAAIDPAVAQLHAMDYRNPAQLPPGAALVVGSGESGCQIAEELRRAGREVYLAVGRCSWLPRRYRGRDCIAWITAMGGFAQTVGSLPGGDPRNAPAGPQLTGQDGGRDLNLHTLARAGVHLLGRLEAADGDRLTFADDLRQRIDAADQAARDFCAAVDVFIVGRRIAAPAPSPLRDGLAPAQLALPTTELNLSRSDVGAVIWATGYRPHYPWVRLPVFAPDGYPLHTRGVTAHPGLFFLGLEWQHQAKSHVFQGIGDDAEHLAEVL